MTSVDVRPSPSERPASVAKDESNGFFSTIFSNAANMIESISKDEKNRRFADQLAEGTTSGQKLDTSVDNGAAPSNISSTSEQATPMASNFPEPFPSLSGQELSASNVHFEPIHESPVSTMGTGNLMLLHFDKKKGKRNSLGSDASRLSLLAVGAGSDNPNRLSVSGDHDTKIVRRKSISNASAVESNDAEILSEHGDVESTETNEAESDQKLDQILDSATTAPASKKRNREFHHAFRKIPSTEMLVDDFSCALSKDILVQGKMYLSAHYICFNSNILGWVTNITIPLREVLQIEKKSTAVLFPNGMVIRTLHQRYVFATFLSRDLTFNTITKVWHEALLEKATDDGVRRTKSRKRGRGRSGTLEQDVTSGGISDYSDQDDLLESVDTSSPGSIDEKPDGISRKLSMRTKSKQPESEEDSLDEIGLTESDVETLSKKDSSPTGSEKDGEASNGFKNPGPKTHAPTKSDYTKELNDVEITDTTFNAPLGVVYDLLFGDDTSTFIKILENQKNFEILNNTIVGISNSNKQREYSYIKPLSGPIGPKQTKCLITDTVKFCDFSKYAEIEQVTSTPDVPSGSSFKVKTRIYLTWGTNNNTNMYVVTTIEWSAKSWIKGAIEKGSIDGQKESMKVFVDTLNETLSSKVTGAPSLKKRKKAKSIALPSPAAKPIETPPKQLTFLEQIEKLIETIGSESPVKIPMVSATVTGIFILVLFSLSYTYCLMKLIGTGGHGLAIEVTSQDSFTKMVKIKDRSYFVLPSSDTYLSHEMNRKINEGNMWKWINDRSGGQLKAENLSLAEGSSYNEFADQEFEEVVKLAKQRIDQLYRQLDS